MIELSYEIVDCCLALKTRGVLCDIKILTIRSRTIVSISYEEGQMSDLPFPV